VTLAEDLFFLGYARLRLAILFDDLLQFNRGALALLFALPRLQRCPLLLVR
jgi:hypothetical protein